MGLMEKGYGGTLDETNRPSVVQPEITRTAEHLLPLHFETEAHLWQYIDNGLAQVDAGLYEDADVVLEALSREFLS